MKLLQVQKIVFLFVLCLTFFGCGGSEFEDKDEDISFCNVTNAKYLYDNTNIINNEYQLVDEDNNPLNIKAITKEKTLYKDKMILRLIFAGMNTECSILFDKKYLLIHYVSNDVDGNAELKYIDSDDNIHIYSSEYEVQQKNIKEIDIDYWDVDFALKLSDSSI